MNGSRNRSCCHLQSFVSYLFQEQFVISLVPIGVALGEFGQGLKERMPGPESSFCGDTARILG